MTKQQEDWLNQLWALIKKAPLPVVMSAIFWYSSDNNRKLTEISNRIDRLDAYNNKLDTIIIYRGVVIATHTELIRDLHENDKIIENKIQQINIRIDDIMKP